LHESYEKITRQISETIEHNSLIDTRNKQTDRIKREEQTKLLKLKRRADQQSKWFAISYCFIIKK
jgi:hypothetical protein